MRTVFFLFKNLPGHFFNNPVKSSKEVSIVDIPFFSQLISCGEVVVRTDDPCLWHWCVNALNRFGYSGLPGNADRKNLPVLTVTSPHEMSWKKMECLLY